MNKITRGWKGAVGALLVLLAGIVIAACGSSSPSSNAASTSTSASASGAGTTTGPANRTALRACLKQHGVTLPTRPAGGFTRTGTGTLPSGTPPTGTSTTGRRGFPGGGAFFGRGNSKLSAALKACGANFGGRFRGGFGGGGFAGGKPSTAAINTFVACVKKNGYTLPKPNLTGTGPIFSASIEKDAKFQAAAKSCVQDLRGSAGSGAAGGAPPAGASGAPPAGASGAPPAGASGASS